jgi:hypothetical protein
MTSVSLSYCFYCECVVSIEPKSLREYLTDWFANLAISIRAALSMPLLSDDERAEADRRIDPDFIGWVHNDPDGDEGMRPVDTGDRTRPDTFQQRSR